MNEPTREPHDQMSQLLAAWTNHEPSARDRLMPLVYEELHRLAHHYMRGERAGHTPQTTALVNECTCGSAVSIAWNGATARISLPWRRR